MNADNHARLRLFNLATVLVVLLLLAAGSGLAVIICMVAIDELDLVNYQVFCLHNFRISESWEVFVLLWFFFWLLVYRLYQRHSTGYFGWREMLRIFFPVLALFSLALVPPGIYSLITTIAVTGICVFRAVFAIPITLPQLIAPDDSPSRRPWLWPGALLALTALMVGFGYWQQQFALNRFFLLYCDWGEYLNIANNTWHGRWFITDDGGANFLTAHFSPASFLLLAPYVGLFHTKEAFMLLNSGILYANVPLLYWLTRELKLPRPAAFLIAAAMLLSPSLLNMNVALFYGFHDIYLVMPLLLLFFIFFERKQWTFAWICFALSLLIKETTPVFWAGLGLVWCAWGRRRSGLALFLVSCLYWLLVMKVFIPAISPRPNYDYLCRFSHLGNSIREIALSPLLHPGVVLEYLFRPGCVYFLLLLLLPVFMAALTHPLLLAGAGITLLGICLQNSNEMQNIHMQYQAETVVLVFITAVYAIRRVGDGQPGWWLKLCHWKLPPRSPEHLPAALLCSCLVTAALSVYSFADFPGSLAQRSNLRRLPDMSGEIAQIQRLVPPGAPINTTLNVGGHFLLRNPVRHNLREPDADWVLLDIDSTFEIQSQLDWLRSQLQRQGYRPVYNTVKLPFQLILYTRTPPPARERPLPNAIRQLSDEQWRNFGAVCPGKNPCPDTIEVKYSLYPSEQPHQLIIAARLLKPTGCDYNFETMLVLKNRPTNAFLTAFGNGITPAFAIAPGATWFQIIALRQPFSGIEDLSVNVVPRAKPSF